jgi:His-Xaa-Ser system protein HxsD
VCGVNFAGFGGLTIDDGQTRASLLLDKAVYSKDAILKACYWLTRDLTFALEEQETRYAIAIALRTVHATLDNPKPAKIEDLISEFFDALLDSQLRIDVQQETASIRELIIAKAFAESGVLEDPPPGTFEDPVALKGARTPDLVQISREKS